MTSLLKLQKLCYLGNTMDTKWGARIKYGVNDRLHSTCVSNVMEAQISQLMIQVWVRNSRPEDRISNEELRNRLKLKA